MERSSPCAAMQPSSLPFGHWGSGFRLDVTGSSSHYGSRLDLETGSFNFKDLSMGKAPTDYFNSKPVRGSSPTSSLAVDLSQNFHIDQSPRLPTPRRCLFSSNLLGVINRRERMVTPPLLSSSPGPSSDSMDVSPLPHKIPFVAAARINMRSPTPESTPPKSLLPSSPMSILDSPLDAARVPVERKRPAMLRPTLSRTKGFSTNAVSMKSAGFESQLQPFKFGCGSSSNTGSLMSLEECFAESPQQGTFSTQPTVIMGPPKPRLAFPNSIASTRSNASPLLGHVRKPSVPSQRPRKQFRRSLSMFEHPAEIMKQQKPDQHHQCDLQSIMDVDDEPQLRLPHFTPDQETMPRITKETMLDVLDGKFEHFYDRSIIVDCRFEYEYKGGHIDGAVNFNDKEELAGQLFQESSTQKTLLILHCEYSAHRAPIAAGHIRREDRAANSHQYPNLTFPEVYILDGGYSCFFKHYSIRCFPRNYVEMLDKEHSNACERGLGRIKQQRTKLSRAQTFAFGQHSQPMEDSPTAVNRRCSDLMMGMDISVSQQYDPQRMYARRMASY